MLYRMPLRSISTFRPGILIFRLRKMTVQHVILTCWNRENSQNLIYINLPGIIDDTGHG